MHDRMVGWLNFIFWTKGRQYIYERNNVILVRPVRVVVVVVVAFYWLSLSARAVVKSHAMLSRYIGRRAQALERFFEVLRPRASPRPKPKSALSCFGRKPTVYILFGVLIPPCFCVFQTGCL